MNNSNFINPNEENSHLLKPSRSVVTRPARTIEVVQSGGGRGIFSAEKISCVSKDGYSRAAFSLLEIVFALAIFAGIAIVVGSLKSSVGVLQNIVGQKLQSEQDVGQSFQIIATDIRSAGQSSIGAYPISAASTSSFSFYSDVDRDGIFELVRYFFVTSTLQRGITKPTGNPLVYSTSTEMVTTSIANIIISSSTPIFSYYDSGYTGSQAPLVAPVDISKVRAVKISVYVDVKPTTAPSALFFTQTITLRNLRGT